MGYVRLQQCNDWGYLYLALPGTGLTKHGMADQKRGLNFNDGQRLHVRWPDNSQTEETIVHRTFHGKICDMGHSYPIEYTRPGVEQSVRGVKHWTPLADLDVLEEDVVMGDSRVNATSAPQRNGRT